MMTKEQLIERDAKRDLGAELLQSVQQMKSGQKGAIHQVQVSQVIEARQKVGFSQRQFADLMGVSLRTLQEWEQGRRNPSRAASSLLRIAMERPDVLKAVFSAELPNAETVAAMQEARAMAESRFNPVNAP